MDNHRFVPIPDVSSSSTLPTWRVQVFRHGVEDPVDELVVHRDNLPSRKRKGKIVWKLPDSVDQLPKFGEPERKRLYEIFKEQKKERRKKLKEQTQQVDQGSTETEEMTPPGSEDERLAEAPKRSKSAFSKVPDEATISAHAPVTSPMLQSMTSPAQRPSTTQPPMPPPGFGMEQLSLDDPRARSFPLHSITQPLGATVVQTFLRCIAARQMEEWIAHWAPNCSKTLLMGTAQAQARNSAEGLQQWSSLAQGSWDCLGWTFEEVTASQPIVVLTGRTLQHNKPMAFSLTLCLQQSQDGMLISREVLCLSP